MRTRFNSSRVLTILALSLTAVLLISASGEAGPKGLDPDAGAELVASGVTQYLGAFTPADPVPVLDEDGNDTGWLKHTFDPAFAPPLGLPEGPVCIAGTDYSVFTRAGKKDKLLIMLQGGGACWQDFYNCNILAEAQEPPAPPVGIWDFDSKDNVFADYSIVYMPYCDGSTFGGDNDVFDPSFPFGPVRFHRGLRNLSAGMDVAAATFPRPKNITVAGSSAGGVGAAAFAPFLARFEYGNNTQLTVFNDAGPIAVNLAEQADVAARAADWQFDQFYPASCTACDAFGQQTAIIEWRLDNDSTIREAFYETEFDLTNRFFTGLLGDPFGYQDLIVTEHGLLNEAHPDRYKRFIVNNADTSHTALQSPLFYSQESGGVVLSEWTAEFVWNGDGDSQGDDIWIDTVEVTLP
jgi:hypothetical protein